MNFPCRHPRRTAAIQALLAASIICSLFPACNLSTPYPSKSLYIINTTAPDRPLPQPRHKDITLRIRRFIALPPFNDEAFVSRLGPNSLRRDYYNVFAAPPADIITSDLIQWLRAAQSFNAVIDASSATPHQWVLEGRIQDLSIDMSDPPHPQAVIALQILLLDDSGAAGHILLDKSYTERVPVASADPSAAAAGWATACSKVFSRITDDLNTVILP